MDPPDAADGRDTRCHRHADDQEVSSRGDVMRHGREGPMQPDAAPTVSGCVLPWRDPPPSRRCHPRPSQRPRAWFRAEEIQGERHPAKAATDTHLKNHEQARTEAAEDPYRRAARASREGETARLYCGATATESAVHTQARDAGGINHPCTRAARMMRDVHGWDVHEVSPGNPSVPDLG